MGEELTSCMKWVELQNKGCFLSVSRFTRMRVFHFAVLSLLLSAGCCSPLRANPKGFGTAKYALVIGCDGLGGFYVNNATSFLPNIAKFYSKGATTAVARDQMPSVSAPNWGTIITGMGPEESGIQDNSWVPADDNPSNPTLTELPPISGAGKIPETMWRVAKEQSSGLKVAVVESWDWIHYLVEPGIVDMEFRGHENDSACGNAMYQFIVGNQPNLMFIHFDSIDDAGHTYQWGTKEYYDAVKNVDSYIGKIFDGLTAAGMMEDTLVVLTADHGGYRYGHGDFNEICMYIPALYMGPGVKEGYNIGNYTTDKDFAPTVLNALGLQPGKYMVGRIVEEIYD